MSSLITGSTLAAHLLVIPTAELPTINTDFTSAWADQNYVHMVQANVQAEPTIEDIEAALRNNINFVFSTKYEDQAGTPWSSQTVTSYDAIEQTAASTLDQIAPYGVTPDTPISITLAPMVKLDTFGQLYDLPSLVFESETFTINSLIKEASEAESQRLQAFYTDEKIQETIEAINAASTVEMSDEQRENFIARLKDNISPEGVAQTLSPQDAFVWYLNAQIDNTIGQIAEKVEAEPHAGIKEVVFRHLGLGNIEPNFNVISPTEDGSTRSFGI